MVEIGCKAQGCSDAVVKVGNASTKSCVLPSCFPNGNDDCDGVIVGNESCWSWKLWNSSQRDVSE